MEVGRLCRSLLRFANMKRSLNLVSSSVGSSHTLNYKDNRPHQNTKFSKVNTISNSLFTERQIKRHEAYDKREIHVCSHPNSRPRHRSYVIRMPSHHLVTAIVLTSSAFRRPSSSTSLTSRLTLIPILQHTYKDICFL